MQRAAVSTPDRTIPAPSIDLAGLGRIVVRWGGSLSLALTFLPTFALVLFLGTLLEGWYDRKLAHELVYGSWWFLALLGLLFINILCAALKKWPWQRHQTGFLVTHLGLLTLVTGGFITAITGSTGLLFLVDSPESAAQNFGAHTSNLVMDRDAEVLRILRPGKPDELIPFAPGPLPWSTETSVSSGVDGLTTVLAALARPWPAGFSKDLGDDVRLEVLTYYPRSRQEPFRAVTSGGFPALQLQLGSAEMGLLPEQWTAFHEPQRRLRIGPSLIEFLARDCLPHQLREFQQPPSLQELGAAGQLVVGFGNALQRIDVAGSRTEQALGSTGWKVRVLDYLPNYRRPGDREATDPAVSFELTSPQGARAGFVTTARQAGDLFPLPGYRDRIEGLAGFWAWLHPADPTYGDKALRGVLQFASTSDGRLWHRSWSTRSGAPAGAYLGFEEARLTALDGARQRLWAGMGWKLQVIKYLPHAVAEPLFEPLPVALGVPEEASSAAVQCRLSRGREAVECWLGKTEGGLTSVTLGAEQFQIGYNAVFRAVPFDLTLVKAEQRMEAGQPAGQASWVLLTDPAANLTDEPRQITLNQPLVHRGYRCYQSGFKLLGRSDSGKPICRGVLTVTDDPGLYIKYLGSIMVACGIAIMFWMRAYFFQATPSAPEPRGKSSSLGEPKGDNP